MAAVRPFPWLIGIWCSSSFKQLSEEIALWN